MRVYLPATLALVRGWALDGVVGPGPLHGFAVTPGLREWYASGDEEELEYAAQQRAALAALRLLTPDGEPVRVVLAVDTEIGPGQDQPDAGAVVVALPVPWRAVAAGLLDDAGAAAAVRAATAALAAGAAEPEDLLSDVEAHELLWFATQELGDL